MTLLTTNLLMKFEKNELVDEAPFTESVYKEVTDLLTAIRAGTQDWIIISNEIGLGLVPVLAIWFIRQVFWIFRQKIR
jgi:adenosyl cobinamide kinase/adenosyl cobinamide phosphate guanylyltransferase